MVPMTKMDLRLKTQLWTMIMAQETHNLHLNSNYGEPL